METKIDVLDNIVLKNTNKGLSAVTSIDFGGANVEFSGSFGFGSVITSITNGVITNTDCDSMFENCSGLTSWNVDLPNITNGRKMFSGCSLTSWNVELQNLTNGFEMFVKCSLSSWATDLPNLTDGGMMFASCSSLISFSANCSALTSYDGMFNGCSNITNVQMIVPNALSGKSFTDFTWWSKSLPYKYVDTIDENTVRLVFTATERTS